MINKHLNNAKTLFLLISLKFLKLILKQLSKTTAMMIMKKIKI